MNSYKIVGLKVNMKAKNKTLKKQASTYLSDKSQISDITISLTDDFIIEKQKQNQHLTVDECEYIWTGNQFYHNLLDFNACMLHASAVAMDNKAYLFSAKSGTGKSTHTELWQRHFGEERAVIINDDKPAIRFIDNEFYAYGTPWSGKTDKNLDIKVPLKGIVFIERSETNWIKRIDSKKAIKLILDQTLRPKQIEKMDKLLGTIDQLLRIVPIYKMGCDISEGAVKLAYSVLNERN